MPLNTNWGPGPVNANWGPGPVNTNWGPGPVNTNWGPGPVNTNCEPGPSAKQRAGGREIQIPVLMYVFASCELLFKSRKSKKITLRVASCVLWVENLNFFLRVASCFLRVESLR